MTEYHKQIKSRNAYTKERIAKKMSIRSAFEMYGIPAFYAYRKTPFNKAAVIPFEGDSLNNGCSFNNDLGEFTAPIKGIYYFYVQAVKIWGPPLSYITIGVLHNKKEVKAQHVSAGHNPGAADVHLPIGIHSMLIMEEGDKMSLRLKNGAMGDMLITPSQPWMHKFTSLTGFLLQAL